MGQRGANIPTSGEIVKAKRSILSSYLSNGRQSVKFIYTVNDRVSAAALISNLYLWVRRLFGSGAYSAAALISNLYLGVRR